MDLACYSGRFFAPDVADQVYLRDLIASVSNLLSIASQEDCPAYERRDAWINLESTLRALSPKLRFVVASETPLTTEIVRAITSWKTSSPYDWPDHAVALCLLLILDCQEMSSTDAESCLRCLLSHTATEQPRHTNNSLSGLYQHTFAQVTAALCVVSMLRSASRDLAESATSAFCEQLKITSLHVTDTLTKGATVLLQLYLLHRTYDATDVVVESRRKAPPMKASGTSTASASQSCNKFQLSVLPADRARQLLSSWSALLTIVHLLHQSAQALNRHVENNPSDASAERSYLGHFQSSNISDSGGLISQLTVLYIALQHARMHIVTLAASNMDLPPLECAFRAGHVNTVITLLQEIPGLVRCSNHEQQTLLHRCAAIDTHSSSNNVSAPASGATTDPLEALLQCPFYVDAVDASGRTALFYCRTASAIRSLCRHGADANALDERGVAPLHHFVLAENVDCVRALLESGADPNIAEPMKRRNALHFAASLCNYRVVDAIVTKAEYALEVDHVDTSGNTALLLAAACQNPQSDPLKTILLLLNHDTDVTVQNNQGISVLHLVCCNPLLSAALEPLVEMLLQKGANPNAQDNDGCTPLIVACAYREFAVCKTLLHAGGDLNISCRMHSTFLALGFVDGDSDHDSANHSHKTDDSSSAAALAHHAITASDLLPKKPRYAVFSSISCAQSKIRSVNRDRCMNCGDYFAGDGPGASFIDALHLTTGRHHCRHCRRVVCPRCAQHTLAADCVPAFVRTAYPLESTYRVCDICFDVLSDRQSTNRIDGSADWTESEASSGDTRDPQDDGGTSVPNSAPNTPYGAPGRTRYFSLAAFGFEF